MKRIQKRILFLLCIGILVMTGCKNEDVSQIKYKIYYLNAEQTGLVEKVYRGETEDTEKAVEEMLECLKKGTDQIEEQSAIPESVELQGFEVNNDRVLLYFDYGYYKMDAIQEVLCRAAIVRSLTQLDKIQLVGIFVGGESLKNANGEPYGFLQAEDFVQNTGSSIHSYEETELKLYYADNSGERLVIETEEVRYNSNTALEKVIVEQILSDPSSESYIRAIPRDTNLLSASVKDDICYLNFDEGILELLPGVKPEITIYSIVNSIVENGPARRVQISINGDSNIIFQESVKLGEPLSRNEDLMKE